MKMPTEVTVVEVGPRDGLQNEAVEVSTADKVELVNRLAQAGIPVIETSAFVRPDLVPQMADAAAVFAAIAPNPGTRYTALVPNLRGFERAVAAGVREVALVSAASEGFSLKNANQSIAESLRSFAQVCESAAKGGVRTRGALAACFGCPYEGAVPAERVAELVQRFLEMGVAEVALCDTIGAAHPGQVESLLEVVLARVPVSRVALHFHDTRGTALANVLVALQMGVSTFDAAVGGLGGCPFAPGASGNLATEELVYMLAGLGIRTGIDLGRLLEAARFVQTKVGHPLPSRLAKAPLWKASTAAS